MPAAELIFPIPNNTEKLDTTTSFAEIPEIKATAICHIPSPAGLSTGSNTFPIEAPKLSDTCSVIPWKLKFSKNQRIIEAIKMVVPAFVK